MKKVFKSYGKSRTSPTELASWVLAGSEFSNQTGTFHGKEFLFPCRGILSGSELEQFNLDVKRDAIDYVVYSYNTPISWHVREDGRIKAHWVMPDVKYSNTTTNHQSRLATALNIAKVWSS